MKKSIIFVVIFMAIISILLSMSCENSIQYGSLAVSVSGIENSRTIQPNKKDVVFASYRIYGSHKTIEGETVDQKFTSKSIQIDRLAIGEWELTAEGYNSDGVLLATSEPQTVDIELNGITKVTYNLDWLEGEGTLSLSVKVQSSRVSTIECQLKEVSSEDVSQTLTMATSTLIDGMYSFNESFTLATGYYDATLTMKDEGGNQLGITLHPSVRVYKGLTSVYDFSWDKLGKLLPKVDSPSASYADGATVPCTTTTINLSTEEDATDIYYSFDGSSYSEYTNQIDITKLLPSATSITLYAYATKANMKQSDVVTYQYSIEHVEDDTPLYAWTESSIGVYQCTGKRVCENHPSAVLLQEEVTASSSIIKDSSCIEEGEGMYTAEFSNEKFSTQTATLTISKKAHDYSSEVVDDKYSVGIKTCTDGQYYKSCSGCGKSSESSEYVFTTTALGHNYVNYKCTRCPYWTTGPADGYVFYDCDADNTDEDPDGADNLLSTVCGWRYLEAAPSDLDTFYVFGYYRETSISSNKTVGTSTAVGTGKANTEALVKAMGDKAYSVSSGTTKEVYAAKACDSYSFEVDDVTYDDWFLPSKDELDLLYDNLKCNGLSTWQTTHYWSSSENKGDNAWLQSFYNGSQDYIGRRYYNRYVRPIRAFL